MNGPRLVVQDSVPRIALRPQQAAEAISVSYAQLRKYVAQGLIPVYRRDRTNWILTEDLLTFVKSHGEIHRAG